jgi:hypothetical protein
MAFTTTARNYMLDQIGTVITHVALFNGSGVEISGGSYARQSVTWSAASGGSKSASNTPVFQIPAGAVVATVRLYSASSGGTEYVNYDATDETYGGAGTYTVNSITLSIT